ncbi:MAG TPA: 50S ribosomal protein L6, partial [Polaribacter sp.]|nr:50S ribosomal protein L6 [Polaribacter sp.]
MSRIGKNPVSISQGVDVSIENNFVTVKGKLGELTQKISDGITIKIEDGIITLDRTSESKDHKAQ